MSESGYNRKIDLISLDRKDTFMEEHPSGAVQAPGFGGILMALQLKPRMISVEVQRPSIVHVTVHVQMADSHAAGMQMSGCNHG
jgi:hypothetical protein